jgi:hypothetical protein
MVGVPVGIQIVGTRTLVFDPALWSLFALNLFFERHGGMLNQIRNLTNRPLEHVGIAGFFTINILLIAVWHDSLGIYTYPAALLGTQLLFSIWFSAATAYPVIGVSPVTFERTVSRQPSREQSRAIAARGICVGSSLARVPPPSTNAWS